MEWIFEHRHDLIIVVAIAQTIVIGFLVWYAAYEHDAAQIQRENYEFAREQHKIANAYVAELKDEIARLRGVPQEEAAPEIETEDEYYVRRRAQ